jgi:hypothetical protein
MRGLGLLAGLLLATGPCLSAARMARIAAHGSVAEDGSITKVIKMLQGMLVKSKEDGEKDQIVFGKYKCYCDSNVESKTKAIERSDNEIKQLTAQIMELESSNGKLSTENAELEMAMADNERARTTAATLRDKENDSFLADELDMKSAIDSLDQAVDTLSAIGADQTAKASLASLKGSVNKVRLNEDAKAALKAASLLLSVKQRKTLDTFLQAPFTGEYQSQSGEIVGILKNMKDTFKSNLATARATEANAVESHTKLTQVSEDEFAKMSATFEAKEKKLSDNDASLSSKKESKTAAIESKDDDEEFLGKLNVMCAKKSAQFEDRKMVRANEEAAISQAVTILNSDKAFESFGDIKATTTGGTGPAFLQVGSQKKISVRTSIAEKLKRVAKRVHSLKLAKIAVQVESGNPFDKVTAELDTMMAIIDKEQKEDESQKEWCDSEREDHYNQLDEKDSERIALAGTMAGQTDDIKNEETGLEKQLADENAKLAQNRKDQKDTIEDRGLENVAYQKNVANMADAEATIKTAIKVLKKFYDWLHAKQGPHHYEKYEGTDSGVGNLKRMPEATIEQLEDACSADPACAGFNSNGYLKSEMDPEEKWYDSDGDLYVKVYDEESPVLLQKRKGKEEPAPPDAFEGEDEGTSGQSDKATEIVEMLAFILIETEKEEDDAHTAELEAQHAFEDEITDLKSQEAATLEVIADLEEQLAQKEKELMETTADHDAVAAQEKAIEKYLLKIKGGCDWITGEIEKRSAQRTVEKNSLQTARDELTSTPVYKEAKAKQEKEALGACADECIPDDQTPECRACQEGVSVVGFCSTHQDHPGCEAHVGGGDE